MHFLPPLEILLPLFETSSCAFCIAERRPALLSAYLFTSIWASFSNESSILKAGDAPPPGERDGRAGGGADNKDDGDSDDAGGPRRK